MKIYNKLNNKYIKYKKVAISLLTNHWAIVCFLTMKNDSRIPGAAIVIRDIATNDIPFTAAYYKNIFKNN